MADTFYTVYIIYIYMLCIIVDIHCFFYSIVHDSNLGLLILCGVSTVLKRM